MTSAQPDYVRICTCGHHNPATEFFCRECSAPISSIAPTIAYPTPPGIQPFGAAEPDQAPYQPPPAPGERHCSRGHPCPADALICPTCSELLAQPATPATPEVVPSLPTVPAGWEALSTPDPDGAIHVRRTSDGREGLFRPAPLPATFSPPIRARLAEIDHPQLHALLDAADDPARPVQIWSHHPETLAQRIAGQRLTPADAEQLALDLASALAALETAQLRPPPFSPESILLRSSDPLGFVLSNLCAVTLANAIGDLAQSDDATLTRYSAPETFIGTHSTATAWWNLGIVLLEALTLGRCFEGLHDRAFLLSVVAHGLKPPATVPPEWRVLLRGLLTNDPVTRWRTDAVADWLAGNRPIIDADEQGPAPTGTPIRLGDLSFTSPARLALAAADPASWDEAITLLSSGALATWLQGRKRTSPEAAELRRIAADRTLDDDARLMLALLVLNPDLPLCYRGAIINEAWVLREPNRSRAAGWLVSPIIGHLKRLERELWLVRLSERAERVRTRAADWEIHLDETALAALQLQTDTAQLFRAWQGRCSELPDSPHRGLAHLIERRSLTDEDLIILLAAPVGAFRAADDVLDEAARLAAEVGLSAPDRAATRQAFAKSRQELLDDVNARLRGFARSGNTLVDTWADAFRLEGRITLAQAVLLLSIPPDAWHEPPAQQYIHDTLTHFQRRLLASIQHGPLARFLIGKSSRRIDISELDAKGMRAATLLQSIVDRSPIQHMVDPAALADRQRDQRLRRMLQDGLKYRRETGIQPLYFAFPLLAVRDDRPGQSARTRLIPILLWPVTMHAAANVQLSFDRDRDGGIRTNPAIEGILGPAFAADVEEAARQVRQGNLPADEIVHIFATLAPARSDKLEPLLAPDQYKLKSGQRATLYAGAFFNCDFTAQTISEDLQRIASGSITSTSLAVALRTANIPPELPQTERTPETYFVCAADPSQKEAVLQARLQPGLVVQGPPGTGKSQTIVNIVSDCLARGERILVVCQKQAALQVVAKRLAAEGLEHRFFLTEDATSSRRPIIQALRDQIATLGAIDVQANGTVKLRRAQALRRLQTIEARLNQMHAATRDAGDAHGLSYREIISRLLELEQAETAVLSVPALQARLIDLDPATVHDCANACAALVALWLPSRFEGSALHGLQRFLPTAAACAEFERAFGTLYIAARHHDALLAGGLPFVKGASADRLAAWLASDAALLQTIPEALPSHVARWAPILSGVTATGSAQIERILEQMLTRLQRLDPADHCPALDPVLAAMNDAALTGWAALAAALDPAGMALRRSYSPMRALRLWRGRKLLAVSALQPPPSPIVQLVRAARHERALRPERHGLAMLATQLGLAANRPEATLGELQIAAAQILDLIRSAGAIAGAVARCPLGIEANAFLRAGSTDGYARLLALATHTLDVAEARLAVHRAIADAERWLAPELLSRLDTLLRNEQSCLAVVEPIAGALPTVVPFQSFRERVTSADPRALALLAPLRASEEGLAAIPPARLADETRRVILREALLAWKDRHEHRHPELCIEPEEFDALVREIGELDGRVRGFNRQLLANGLPLQRITTHQRWNGVLNLGGSNQRTLRQLVEEGETHGLFDLRPVWLVNPEVASRIFPRRAAMFDVVVFDEASQLPVENTLPALFRAKRFIVSGDEKQLPPTSFFISQLSHDTDEPDDMTDPGEDAEIAAANGIDPGRRRLEVREASDLLKLSQHLLPSRTLRIHYRSRYRELIEFSNAAFYRGELNIPARHSRRALATARPIEVHHVKSVYANQTNPEEADAVVEYLRKLWRKRERPSVGVLTFNLKQADLIQERIETAVAESEEFSRAYARECERQSGGEDHSFFVKNLENVQGDERDCILLSTTFGRDADGHFRRTFGALSQTGGERRLNVAVTRAKQKVVIITSMPVAEISNFMFGKGRPDRTRDYLQAYLDYASKLHDGDIDAAAGTLARLRTAGPDAAHPSGDDQTDAFIDHVERFLREQGIEVIRIASNDAFAFDLGIVDAESGAYRLGIECDAPHHPLLETVCDREVWRPAILKPVVPYIHRIWSRRWYEHGAIERQRLLHSVKTALADRRAS